MLEQRWRFEQVAWGETECGRRGCSEPAELLLDGLPRCLDCADEEVERLEAVSLRPDFRELLPGFDEAA